MIEVAQMAAAAAVQGQFGAAGKCSSMLLQESKLGQQATPTPPHPIMPALQCGFSANTTFFV